MDEEKITKERLEKLARETEDGGTKILIKDLKKQIESNQDEFIQRLSFDRILNAIKHEKNKNKLQKFNSKRYEKISYELKVSLRGKKRILIVDGESSLEKLSYIIQGEFDLESMHLYEFEIGSCKYGPKCDEWREMFDALDDFKIEAAISFANLKQGDKFKFLYDFGDMHLFEIKILKVGKLAEEVTRNGRT